ncbi:hypothetical protein CVT24_011362 [Panaeolus cyanescens]|uniref:DUF6534 domain-containing protein n=1 Tax=Panaeolus cyanescens TaxID=181874 RepID=A0A409YGT1_9AGAR|nr:hypothetical protein CVT24_011362 [Panaeolus cyanescens]
MASSQTDMESPDLGSCNVSQRNFWLTAGILVFSIANFATGITVVAKSFSFETFTELNTISSILFACFSVGTIDDLFIALALLYLFRKIRTGLSRTDSVLRLLMIYTVNTGMLVLYVKLIDAMQVLILNGLTPTATYDRLDAVLSIATYAALPDSLIFFALYVLSSKLYLSAYLAGLNARKSLAAYTEDGSGIGLVSIRFTNGNGPFSSRTARRETDTSMPKQNGGYLPFGIDYAHAIYLCRYELPKTRESLETNMESLGTGSCNSYLKFYRSGNVFDQDISIVGTAMDLVMVLAQLYLFQKSRTGLARTDCIIRDLMMYTVNTGMVVLLDATLGIITYAARPDDLIFFSFYLLSSKLYISAYLATLNARRAMYAYKDEEVASIRFTSANGFFPSCTPAKPETASSFPKQIPMSSMELAASGSTTAVAISTLVETHYDSEAEQSEGHATPNYLP